MASIFQHHRDREKHGDRAPWTVKWRDASGRQHTKKVGNRRAAKKEARKLEGEMAAGLTNSHEKVSWEKFVAELFDVAEGGDSNIDQLRYSLEHFKRIINPRWVDGVTARTIDRYKALRGKEVVPQTKNPVSPQTIRKELRYIRLALKRAESWGYCRCPQIKMPAVTEKLVRVVDQGHFRLLYDAGDQYWKALLLFPFMTGWRISEIMGLRWSDVDLAGGTAILHSKTKGRRAAKVPLHGEVLKHINPLRGGQCVFEPLDVRRAQEKLKQLQEAVGIHLPCSERHNHVSKCHKYIWHDFRRSFASANAAWLPAPILQQLMRHRSFETTLLYVNLANKLDGFVEKIHCPIKRWKNET